MKQPTPTKRNLVDDTTSLHSLQSSHRFEPWRFNELNANEISMSGARRNSALACGLAILLFHPGDARSDQVWVEPLRPTSNESDWYPRGIEVHRGEVKQFDAGQVRIQPDDEGDDLVFAAARVLWIEPETVSDLETEAMRLFADGEYSSSLSKLPDILGAKPPIWRQQWITMMAAVAAWKSGRGEIALELVSQLDRRPLPPIAVSWSPIAWTNRPASREAIAAAEARLNDRSPLVQLIAASWLLSSPKRSEAIAVLKRLESQPRPNLARFARVLTWRAASPPEVIESADDWEGSIEKLPMVLQTGPLTLLVDKLRAAGESDRAERLRWSLELTPIHPHYAWLQSRQAE